VKGERLTFASTITGTRIEVCPHATEKRLSARSGAETQRRIVAIAVTRRGVDRMLKGSSD
jgi:hypothetical protein